MNVAEESEETLCPDPLLVRARACCAFAETGTEEETFASSTDLRAREIAVRGMGDIIVGLYRCGRF